jgi:hypothetical protein
MFDPFAHLSGPVPDYLKQLLAIQKKAALEAFCRTIEITQHDLCVLIVNAGRIGYRHDMHHHQFRPAHLESTEAEVASPDRQKFLRKVSQIFAERRLFVAHTFFNDARWHAFYFDQRDHVARSDNHWRGGPHVYFVNDLWPEYTLENFWDSANEPSPKFRETLHIRYKADPEKALSSLSV